MLRRVAMESGLVLVLTAMLMALAATAGLPGRSEPPEAEAAEESPTLSPDNLESHAQPPERARTSSFVPSLADIYGRPSACPLMPVAAGRGCGHSGKSPM